MNIIIASLIFFITSVNKTFHPQNQYSAQYEKFKTFEALESHYETDDFIVFLRPSNKKEHNFFQGVPNIHLDRSDEQKALDKSGTLPKDRIFLKKPKI